MPDFLFKRGGDPATGIGNHADSAKMAGTLEPRRQMFHAADGSSTLIKRS
ncbi:hypothetical protein NKJ93_05630 [Mesorhizobium sp. M0028]